MCIMRKKFFPLIFLCMLSFGILYADMIQQNLSGNLLRMHIIANSNSEFDQRIKYAVRDRILLCAQNDYDTNEVSAIAENELNHLGAGYGAKASIERCYVPEKRYKDLHLPEGVYTCLRVVLGTGTGENWWCVAYPPLCFSEEIFGGLSEEGKAELRKSLDAETLKVIVDSGEVNFRFKIVEDIKKLERFIRT